VPSGQKGAIEPNRVVKTVVAGLEAAHLPKTTSSFELSVLTLTVPGLRLRQVQNPLYF
jgi:hypothetical protein